MSKTETMMYSYIWECRLNADDHKHIESWIAGKVKAYDEETKASRLFETYHACQLRNNYLLSNDPEYKTNPEYWNNEIESAIIIDRVSRLLLSQNQ